MCPVLTVAPRAPDSVVRNGRPGWSGLGGSVELSGFAEFVTPDAQALVLSHHDDRAQDDGFVDRRNAEDDVDGASFFPWFADFNESLALDRSRLGRLCAVIRVKCPQRGVPGDLLSVEGPGEGKARSLRQNGFKQAEMDAVQFAAAETFNRCHAGE
jgi:hypothetical protein